MGPHRYRRMKKALAGPCVNRPAGPNDVYVLRLSNGLDSRPDAVRDSVRRARLRHERVAMLAA
jgi:hypothetical protein